MTDLPIATRTDNVIDGRSTYRKRARKVLQAVGRPYWCGSTIEGGVTEWGCGKSPKDPNAPGLTNKPGDGYDKDMSELQCNHINKDISDCDPANLEWLCASCHKKKDNLTEKGESLLGSANDEFGYGVATLAQFLSIDWNDQSYLEKIEHLWILFENLTTVLGSFRSTTKT